MASSSSSTVSTPTLLVGGVLALALVAGYVVLATLHVDTVGYAAFIGGPLSATVLGALLTRRVAAVQATADSVQNATNGMLSGRLDNLDSQLSDAHDQRTAIAAGAPVPPPAAGPPADTAGAHRQP